MNHIFGMYKFLWLDLNWPIWVFVMALVALIIVVLFVPFATIKKLAFALVIYLGVYWLLWWWVPLIFWIIGVIVGVVGFIIYQVMFGRPGNFSVRMLAADAARFGSSFAAGIAAILLVVSALTSFVGLFDHVDHKPTPNAIVKTPSPSTSTTPAPSPTKDCPETWELKQANHEGNRLFAEGVVSIRNAKTKAQAAAAAHDWVHKVQYDPINLSGAVNYFLGKNVTVSQMKNGKCASDLAAQYAVQLESYMSTADISPDYAPANGTNSGVDNGQVVSATQPGITGDSKSIKVVHGRQVTWIMARCGNPVTLGKAPVPPGKTEHQPKPPESPPPTHHPCKPHQWWNGHKCLTPKDPSKDPQSQGNVPDQATKHSPSTDNSAEAHSPASRPTDSGNGIPSGSTPRVTPSSATSTTSHSSGPTVPPPTTTATSATGVTASPTATGTVTEPGS